MEILALMLMLATCAASPQDLSGKMFTFPQETSTTYVKMTPSKSEFTAFTLCHRSFTDLKRDHVLFSLATTSNSNGILLFWDQTNQEMEPHVLDRKTEYRGWDYKPNMWHSICTTWDSTSGLVQMWFNGRPSIKKFTNTGSSFQGTLMIMLGQEQDSHGGGFDAKQSFVGMMTDVHMWDYVLSPCQIHEYNDELQFTPGNVLNWKELEFQIRNRVLIEEKLMTCH